MAQSYILIAEDDADDRFLLETVFAERQYPEEISFVENGVELLDFLVNLGEKKTGSLPRFILLDLNMPKKDGREALREIKSDQRFCRIPVIVFTTTKSEHEINRCYELGANAYIVKPTSYSQLVQVLEELRNFWLNTASIPL